MSLRDIQRARFGFTRAVREFREHSPSRTADLLPRDFAASNATELARLATAASCTSAARGATFDLRTCRLLQNPRVSCGHAGPIRCPGIGWRASQPTRFGAPRLAGLATH